MDLAANFADKDAMVMAIIDNPLGLPMVEEFYSRIRSGPGPRQCDCHQGLQKQIV